MPKDFLYNGLLDHYQPEFDRIGFQPITYKEVCPMNVPFIDVSGDASWNIEPQFRRDMDMATAWEMEKASQRKALQVLRQKKFGDKYINPQNN